MTASGSRVVLLEKQYITEERFHCNIDLIVTISLHFVQQWPSAFSRPSKREEHRQKLG